MDSKDLVRMANQIAAYFSAYPKSEAIDGIGKHVHLFWDPRMRNEMKAYLDASGEGLSPLFLEAAADYFKGPKSPAVKANIARDTTPNKGAEPSSTRGT
ncbi:MAG: formate dehydrogenase subunit delta [Hyphomicrobium sp.]